MKGKSGMEYLLGIDVGTSGTKTVLYDRNGEMIAQASREYPMQQPSIGRAEEKPEDWWNATVATLQSVLERSGIPAEQICGIGFSGQMHSLVMLDGDLQVLRPAILWCDGRTRRECDDMNALIGSDRLLEISANPALTGFTASKLLWVRRNEPEVFRRCKHVLLPKDYVRLKLTGVLATDVSDASGTNLLNVGKRAWSTELIERLGLDAQWFPPLLESCESAGRVTVEAAALTGLKAGIPVAAGAADNAASAVGTGTVTQGSVFNTIGTSGVIFAHSDRPAIAAGGQVHTICAAVPNGWGFMSCTLAAGLSLRWFRDNFCGVELAQARAEGVDAYALLDREAAEIAAGAEGVIFLPYLMGERSPLLDETCRGVFFGLSAAHGRSHLLRAVMEGVAYSQRACLDVFRSMGLQPTEMKLCGGGAKSALWRQILADQFHLPVSTMKSEESPTLGAAILAGVCSGVYSDVPTGCSVVQKGKTGEVPQEAAMRIYDAYYPIYRNLYTALRGEFFAAADAASK